MANTSVAIKLQPAERKQLETNSALSEALGRPVTLAREAAISHLDAGPLHLLTTASLAWLRVLLPNARVDDRRFRPNILIDVLGAIQVERLWLGKALYIGEKVTLRVRDLAERCVMVNLSQADLPDDPRRSVGRDTRPHFGVRRCLCAARSSVITASWWETEATQRIHHAA